MNKKMRTNFSNLISARTKAKSDNKSESLGKIEDREREDDLGATSDKKRPLVRCSLCYRRGFFREGSLIPSKNSVLPV